MEPVPVVRRALRRSRVRSSILLALLRVPQATLEDLVRVTGAQSKWVRAALYGRLPAYRPRDALVRLRLVEDAVEEGVVVFALSPVGRRLAEDLRADLERVLAARPVLQL